MIGGSRVGAYHDIGSSPYADLREIDGQQLWSCHYLNCGNAEFFLPLSCGIWGSSHNLVVNVFVLALPVRIFPTKLL